MGASSDPTPVKPMNKAEQSAAESVEGSGGTKRNVALQSTDRMQSREAVTQAQDRIRGAVTRNKKEKLTDDGKILNIAGDYISHGVRARASELVTIELGHQSEWEVQQKLGLEINQDRFTRLDRVLLQEVNPEHVADLRPGH